MVFDLTRPSVCAFFGLRKGILSRSKRRHMDAAAIGPGQSELSPPLLTVSVCIKGVGIYSEWHATVKMTPSLAS
jgi:hypothetical protein